MEEWVGVNIPDASKQFLKGKAENQQYFIQSLVESSQIFPCSFGLDLCRGVAAKGMFNPHWALIHAATENENLKR